LQDKDTRLFADPQTIQFVYSPNLDPVLAERLDAFVSCFSRLQDNLGDKLLPQLLNAMAEKTGAYLKNWTALKNLVGLPRQTLE